MEMTYCQSCGLPFDTNHEEFIAREKDGSKSMYCTFCYEDGAFTQPDATAHDMIEIGVPHLARKIGEAAAREQLAAFVPTLLRWKQ